VSAYIPNRATGEVLPGLAEMRGVEQFQELTKQFKSLDEAKGKETIQKGAPPPAPEASTPESGV